MQSGFQRMQGNEVLAVGSYLSFCAVVEEPFHVTLYLVALGIVEQAAYGKQRVAAVAFGIALKDTGDVAGEESSLVAVAQTYLVCALLSVRRCDGECFHKVEEIMMIGDLWYGNVGCEHSIAVSEKGRVVLDFHFGSGDGSTTEQEDSSAYGHCVTGHIVGGRGVEAHLQAAQLVFLHPE